MKGKTFGQWLFLLFKLSFISLFAFALSGLLFTLANFSDVQEKLVQDIRIGEPVQVKKDLIRLNYFYNLSKQWKVQWLADKYLFQDAPFYQIADFYLIRDWQKVMADLKEQQDDVRSYPYGNAKFRQKKAEVQTGAVKFAEGVDFVLKEVSVDFERDLRNCLGTFSYEQCSDRVWNYDMATNKKAVEEALRSSQPGPKRILGPLRPKEGPPLIPDSGKKKDGFEGEGEKGSQSSPRKRP